MPDNMLVLIHKINIPNMQGMEKIRPNNGEDNLFWRSIIIIIIPAENKTEKMKEYPIKWTDSDCCNKVIMHSIAKIKGRKTCIARFDFWTKKYIPIIDTTDRIAMPANEKRQL